MRAFTELFENLDSTTSTNEKIAALKKYFAAAHPRDAIWAVMILTSRVRGKSITSKVLRDLFLLETRYPEWLLEESYHHVGDTAETLSLLLGSLGIAATSSSREREKSLADWMEKEIPALIREKDLDRRRQILFDWWKELTPAEIFILNKLMTGGFRVGVSEKLVVRALAEVFGLPTDQIAHRLSGRLDPTPEGFARLISQEEVALSWSQPYPFCLAHSWSDRKEEGYVAGRWCIEWKYDGIRAQIIKRDGKILLWSRGEEQINDAFPDLLEKLKDLPDGTVLDGEVLVIRDGLVADFNDLQRRLGRKKVSPAMLREFPAGLIAYDCLEAGGIDQRDRPLRERREELQHLLSPLVSESVRISESLFAIDVEKLEELRAQAREHQAEGLMLKDWDSKYVVGRKVGGWWKHKVEPLTLDAVLIYAQAGTGRRANLHTDYTFALWRDDELVPFAKAYSGLDQKEIDELDFWIRRHTKEKFGPVRSLEIEHVFEIAFEGISESTRHKSGIAVRFPRILRWRRDKKPRDADTLETARELLHIPPPSPVASAGEPFKATSRDRAKDASA